MLEIFDYLKAQLETRVSPSERGAAAVEYGMLVALIAAVIVGVVLTLGKQINVAFHDVSDKLPSL
jgi:pilus assembly protein Flp/PilA